MKDMVVWYEYYQTDGSKEQIDECRLEHRDTIILSPSDVPLEAMKYELMNYQTQQTVRQLLTALAMIRVGNIYAKFSGAIRIPNSELTLSYATFLDNGKAERDRVLTELKERYSRLLPWNMAEQQQKLAQAQLEILKTKTFPMIYVR
jgi:hypothetical protein